MLFFHRHCWSTIWLCYKCVLYNVRNKKKEKRNKTRCVLHSHSVCIELNFGIILSLTHKMQIPVDSWTRSTTHTYTIGKLHSSTIRNRKPRAELTGLAGQHNVMLYLGRLETREYFYEFHAKSFAFWSFNRCVKISASARTLINFCTLHHHKPYTRTAHQRARTRVCPCFVQIQKSLVQTRIIIMYTYNMYIFK